MRRTVIVKSGALGEVISGLARLALDAYDNKGSYEELYERKCDLLLRHESFTVPTDQTRKLLWFMYCKDVPGSLTLPDGSMFMRHRSGKVDLFVDEEYVLELVLGSRGVYEPVGMGAHVIDEDLPSTRYCGKARTMVDFMLGLSPEQVEDFIQYDARVGWIIRNIADSVNIQELKKALGDSYGWKMKHMEELIDKWGQK